MYKRILCTLDGSPLAEKALPHATAVARAFDAQLILLRVVEPPRLPAAPELGTFEMDLLAQLAEEAEEYVKTKAGELREQGVNAHGVALDGHPVEVIAEYAKEHDIDLIVMATHGRSGLSRLAFGSVADRVLRLAHCPVLLIRARES